MKSKLYASLIIMTLFFSGCTGIDKRGALQLRSNFILLKKDYKKYLDADPRYEDDEQAKEDRLKLIDESVSLIDESLK